MRRVLLLILLCAAAPLAAAQAEDGVFLTGALKTMGDRGTIRIGYREAAVPFAFMNPGKQPVGFSVDLCHAIAVAAAAALNRDLLEPGAPAWQQGLRIDFVPVAADARLPMLLDGRIDLECGSTTANAERAKSVAFSPVFFLAGTKLAVPAASTATSYRDLAGKTVAVSIGTTNEAALKHLAPSTNPPMQLITAPSLDATFPLLTAGKADAVASDDILLIGLLTAHKAATQYKVIGDYLSFEPYAIAFRKDDAAFADLVRTTFDHLADAGTLTALYKRWFLDKLPNGETLNLPMSNQLSEMYRGLGQGN